MPEITLRNPEFNDMVSRWTDIARQMDSLRDLTAAAGEAVACPTDVEVAAATAALLSRADELRCRRDLALVIRTLKRERCSEQLASAAPPPEEAPWLQRDGHGGFKRTIANFLAILQFDPQFEAIRYDELARQPAVVEQKLGQIVSARPWADADDAAAQQYIEEVYGLYDPRKFKSAFCRLLPKRAYHPIRACLEQLEWDGKARIDRFLYDWAGCPDTEYTRAVSRLLFSGGIRRLYEPGCKFDYVVVLIGEQGAGKSTLVRWLALDERWFGELTVLDGKEAVEQLSGCWIVEMSELLALHRAREQEAVKSFISRQRDHYRRPYAEHPEVFPRQSIIIGTTNDRRFLRDKTGNRRFLPVEVHRDGYHLYHLEKECRAEIAQCWAEALARYRRGELSPVIDARLRADCRAAQDAAMEDDWRVGAIAHYLESRPEGSCVCVRQVYRDALQPDTDYPKDPNQSEAREVAQILDRAEGWKRVSAISFLDYGKQRAWKKLSN